MAKLMLVCTEQLLEMRDVEGIVFPGCGGDLNEWIDGVNNMLTEEGILLNGTAFSHVSVFQDGETTNLLFHFTDDVKMDIAKLAMWRILTHEHWGAKWFSDYMDNYIRGFEREEIEDNADMDLEIQ